MDDARCVAAAVTVTVGRSRACCRWLELMLVHKKSKPTVRRVLLSPTRFVAYQLDIVGTRRQSAIECRVARELGEYFSPASTLHSMHSHKTIETNMDRDTMR
jgi:hypothetical protein